MALKKILLVDDEYEIISFFEAFFEDRDYQVSTAENGIQALKVLETEDFDLVISDMMMPEMQGIEFVRRLKEKKPDQKVIFMSGVKEESMMAKAKSLGVVDYINKPVSLPEVEAKVLACLDS